MSHGMTWERFARNGLIACAILFGAMVLARNDPERSRIFPKCPVWQLTGLYCSGCGSTRASHHLLNGRIDQALRYNPLAVIAIPLLVIMAARPERFRRPWIAWTVLSVLIGYSILRNVDRWPFRYLAPPPPAASANSESISSLFQVSLES